MDRRPQRPSLVVESTRSGEALYHTEAAPHDNLSAPLGPWGKLSEGEDTNVYSGLLSTPQETDVLQGE